jgi:choline monooxygenase
MIQSQSIAIQEQFIPVEWYVWEDLFQKELMNVFDREIPCYYGHRSMVPNHGDFHVAATTQNSKTLVNHNDRIALISNICRHRQSLILTGRGNQKSLICPVHAWQYDLNGEILNSPKIERQGNCYDLQQTEIKIWNYLIFKSTSNISFLLDRISSLDILAKNTYLFGSNEVTEMNYNWKIFMETYLDLYHIAPLHPGLRGFADCQTVKWEINDDFSSQTVDVKLSDRGDNPSPFYSNFLDLIKQIPDFQENHKITWFALYPNVTIEIYPYNLVITTIVPKSANQTVSVVDFLYDSQLDRYSFGQELHQSFKAAYLETAAEDDIACRNIQLGRQSLVSDKKEEHGPFHPTLELGIPSFYNYLLNYL